MRIAVSKRAVLTAAILVACHVLAFAYVEATNMLYDQGDLLGLLWWLVAFWVFPLLAGLVLIVSVAGHLHDHQDRGN